MRHAVVGDRLDGDLRLINAVETLPGFGILDRYTDHFVRNMQTLVLLHVGKAVLAVGAGEGEEIDEVSRVLAEGIDGIQLIHRLVPIGPARSM